MARILGIDLGTTNSVVAVLTAHGEAKIIPNREGQNTTPSVVFFEEGGNPIVGSTAKNLAMLDPLSYVQFVKRSMGDPTWTFVSESEKIYRPEDISAMILRRLKEDAGTALNETFTHAVITVPAYFNDAQRLATRQAGEIAGFVVAGNINEPTAAALAYGIEATNSGKVMVYDLGGGTFDVTILDVAPHELNILATGGEKNLGGLNWDNEIMRWLNKSFMEAGGVDLIEDAATEHELRDKAERAKIALSQMSAAKVVLSSSGRTLPISLPLETFEDLTRDLLELTEGIMEAVLEDAGLKWRDISKVLLVGGSTRMKAVSALIERVSGIKPSHELHADEVVACGAAILAGKLALDLPEFRPRKQNTSLPDKSGSSVAPPTRVGGINLVEINLTDVTAHSLGFIAWNSKREALENYIVLKRNTAVPCSLGRDFYTLFDDQELLKARITQGEDSDPGYVDIIGEAEIRLPFRKPAGTPFTVTFSYDIDGMLHVAIADAQTGQPFREIEIERKANLTKQEVDEARARLSDMVVG